MRIRPVSRGFSKGYPCAIQSFLSFLRGARSNSAQTGLTTFTLLRRRGSPCASSSILISGLSPGPPRRVTAGPLGSGVHECGAPGVHGVPRVYMVGIPGYIPWWAYPGTYHGGHTRVYHRVYMAGYTIGCIWPGIPLGVRQGGGYTPGCTAGRRVYLRVCTGCVQGVIHRFTLLGWV